MWRQRPQTCADVSQCNMQNLGDRDGCFRNTCKKQCALHELLLRIELRSSTRVAKLVAEHLSTKVLFSDACLCSA
eukprot:6338479-Amphidinium_carterae.1